jgi:hypothetical protein
LRRPVALLVLAVLAGCGARSPDLFLGKEHQLDGDRLLRARAITRALAKPAELGLELPPGPGANLSYKVSLEAGHVAFSDTSKGNPQAFFEIAAFTKDVSERVCGIVRQ